VTAGQGRQGSTLKVEFHSGVAEPLAHTCRLLRKAHAAGARVVVQGPGTLLNQLDQALWTFDALSFVPHVRLRADARPSAQQARTPTWLVDDVTVVADREVLVNLGSEMVEGWQTFARVIEIVAADEPAVQAGRQRWRRYQAQPGVELVNHSSAGAG
jgi:DNA polymerase III subunit chi